MPVAKKSALIPAKILVPVDFSSSSHLALEQAAAYAQQFDCRDSSCARDSNVSIHKGVGFHSRNRIHSRDDKES